MNSLESLLNIFATLFVIAFLGGVVFLIVLVVRFIRHISENIETTQKPKNSDNFRKKLLNDYDRDMFKACQKCKRSTCEGCYWIKNRSSHFK